MSSYFRFVEDEGLEQMANFKCVAGAYTPLDNLLNPFWLWCQSKIPRWISPNLITVTGGAIAITGCLVVLVGRDDGAVWPFAFAAVCIFLYQTADAVDGKHARLTAQSSGLGGVIDHGTDATVGSVLGVALCSAVNPDLTKFDILLAYNFFVTVWFCSQWKYKKTGVLETKGITEGEFIVIGMLLLCTLPREGLMHHIWDSAPAFVALVCAPYALFLTVEMVFRERQVGVLRDLAPVAVQFAFSIPLWLWWDREPRTRMLVLAAHSCALMTKMVLSATTGCHWPVVLPDSLPYIALVAVIGAGIDLPPLVLQALVACQCVALALTWHDTITRICARLNVPFLGAVPAKTQ